MICERQPCKTKKKSSIGFVEEVRRSRPLYLLMLPSIIIFALFTYYPMYGIVIAFKNFTLRMELWEAAGLD